MKYQQLNDSDPKQLKRDKLFAQILFLIAGISSTIANRAVVSALDFFEMQFPKESVSFWFAIPVYTSCIVFSIFIIKFQQKIQFQHQVYMAMSCLFIFNISIPIFAYIIPNRNGFYLFLIQLFLQAYGKVVAHSCFLGFANIFNDQNYSAYFMTGSAISGVITSSIRMLCLKLLVFNDSDIFTSTIIYFLISGLFLIIICILIHFFLKTQYYQNEIKYNNNNKNKILIQNQCQSVKIIEYNVDDNKTNFQIIKFIKLNISMIAITFAITYSLYPGIVLMKKYQFLDKSWNTATITLCFEIFDTIGKYLNVKICLSNQKATLITMLRFLFFFIIISINQSSQNSFLSQYWLILIVTMALGFTSGFNGTNHINLVPQRFYLEEKKNRKSAGYITTFFIFFGVLLGSFVGIFLKNIL